MGKGCECREVTQLDLYMIGTKTIRTEQVSKYQHLYHQSCSGALYCVRCKRGGTVRGVCVCRNVRTVTEICASSPSRNDVYGVGEPVGRETA